MTGARDYRFPLPVEGPPSPTSEGDGLRCRLHDADGLASMADVGRAVLRS